MKSFRFTLLLASISLLVAGTASCINAHQTGGASASSSTPKKREKYFTQLPPNVDIYATMDVGDEQVCKVGAKSDQDGMSERPVVYLVKASGAVAWHVQLPISKDMYQGRATHCVVLNDKLYVLVQIDTQSQQSLSQTLLKVVELNKKNGAVIVSDDIQVPNISSAYSAWVDEGGDRFKLDGNKLVIKGSYELLSDRNNSPGKEPYSFTVEVPEHLRP